MARSDRPARAARNGSAGRAFKADALPSRALLLASAPLILADPPAAVFPARQCRLRQTVFGWEAQLHAFFHALAAEEREVFFTPAPEIFAFLPSFRHIAEATGRKETDEIVHLRFGSTCFARVLKSAHNMVVLAEAEYRASLTPSHHPFAGDCLPAAVEKLLLYQPLARLPRRIDGGALPTGILPRGFIDADLIAAAARPPLPVETMLGEGLVRSFAEFDRAEWETPRAMPAIGDWRGASLLRALTRERGEAPPVQIMMPWNLADPASIVPDVVGKLARAGGLGAGFRLVVFPYNETAGERPRITAMIDAARAALIAAPGDLRHFFLARVPRPEDALRLRDWFEIAWLEAGAPDRWWNEERLAALGVRVGIIAAPRTAADTPSCLAPADEEILINAHDVFGERLFRAETLSPRALAALLAHTHAAIRLPPARKQRSA